MADKLKITHIQDPQYITVSPDGTFAHVGCYGDPHYTGNRSLNLINLATQTITKSVVPGYVISAVLSPDGRRIYVCATNFIAEYDATDLTLVRTYTRKYIPVSLALSPDNTRFYCAITDTSAKPYGKLEVINIADGQTIRTIDVGWNLGKTLINPEGSLVYVTGPNGIGDTQGGVGVIDTSTLRVVDVIDTGKISSDMIASPDWEFLYVARNYSNELIEISTRTNKVTRRIPTKLKITKLAITPDGKHLCGLGPENNNEATIFDTNTLDARPIPAGRKPSAVAFSKDGQRIYICNFQDDNLWDVSWL
ncbi:WD40-like Beta Propeller Repeat protein [Pseudomonas fluorescens]|nr:WD40-like Beta Propeller Repeat protein [Pseudomonas fluorescens]